MVLTTREILRSAGLSPVRYWLLPGNNRRGYCNEKVFISTSLPLVANTLARLSMIVARPPLYGYAGPKNEIFNSKLSIFNSTLVSFRAVSRDRQ